MHGLCIAHFVASMSWGERFANLSSLLIKVATGISLHYMKIYAVRRTEQSGRSVGLLMTAGSPSPMRLILARVPDVLKPADSHFLFVVTVGNHCIHGGPYGLRGHLDASRHNRDGGICHCDDCTARCAGHQQGDDQEFSGKPGIRDPRVYLLVHGMVRSGRFTTGSNRISQIL